VTIEGISYVKSFREDFATEIEEKGLDAVIHRLEAGDFRAPGASSGPAKKGG
jgi:ABC-type transporter MlaC component